MREFKNENTKIQPCKVGVLRKYPSNEEKIVVSNEICSDKKRQKGSTGFVTGNNCEYLTDESVVFENDQLLKGVKNATKVIADGYQMGMTISELPNLMNTDQLQL